MATPPRNRADASAPSSPRAEANRARRPPGPRLGPLFALAPGPILVADRNGRLLDANPAALDRLRYARARLRRLGLRNLVARGHAWAQPGFADSLRTAIWEGEVDVLAGDGETLPLEARVALAPIGDGEQVVVFLRESAGRDRPALGDDRLTAFRAMNHAAVSVTLAGDVAGWNPAAERLFGYAAAAAVGRPFAELVPPESARGVADLVLRASRGHITEGFAIAGRRRDGQNLEASVSIAPVRGPDEEVAEVVAVAVDVSAQRSAERALAVAEARFRALIGNATDIITILAADGTILFESRPIERILGYGRDDLVGRSAFALVHPDDRERVWTAFDAALADPSLTPTEEFRFRHRDGSWRWLEATGSNLLGDDAVGGFVVNSRDVTARVEAEAALARERDLLRTLMAHLPDAVYVKDRASRFLRLNPAAARTLGIPDPAEALGKTDFDFFPESLAARYYDDEQRVIATGEPLLNRLEPQSVDEESAAWWLTSTVPLRDAAGAVVGIVGSGRDITERLRTERALQESEARHRALLTALPDLVFRLDRDGTYLDYKADRLADLAAPPEFFLGRRMHEVLPADVADAIMTAIERVLGAGRGETVEYALELAGARRHFEARLVAAGADEVVAVVRDVTERKRSDEELRAALDAARAANAAARDFLSMMSHELRTPMQAIVGYAELLLAESADPLTEQQVEDVRTIHRGASRLVDLVKQMLDFSRLEAGQMELKSEPVALGDVIEAVQLDVAPQAAAKGLALRVDVASDLPWVRGDAMGMHLILLNLVGNAVKFTEAGEVRIEVAVVDDGVEAAVSDTGIGIPTEALPRVFEAFRQADSGIARRFGGAGLGLYIAEQLARQQGATIRVASDPGRGSNFVVRFPAAE